MARARKKHVQQELVYWGGKRKGAGRPPKNKRSSERHKTRPEVRAAHPQHVTLRVEKVIGTLRRRSIYHAVRKALRTVLGRHDYRVIDVSLQDGHVHLTVEAEDKVALAKGMQAFEIAAARYINQAFSKEHGRRRRGRVFSDRYHPKAITSPLAARHARAYVLNNWRRHGKDRGVAFNVDPFSSSVSFDGWKATGGTDYLTLLPAKYEPLPVSRPQTWLLKVGWRRHGLISVREVPGERARRLVA
ncbi:MAG: transposase [Deltaproteobacteria bacterium]|nr:transposase [Deltaproteobacteria bacterium]